MRPRLLVIDDDRDTCEVVELGLSKRGFEVEWRSTGEEGLRLFEESDFDVVVADVRLNDMSGLAICERIATNRPDVPVLMMTAYGNMDTAVAAIRVGAYDFITKPLDMQSLAHAVHRAQQHRELTGEVKRLRQAADRSQPREMIGSSPAVRRIYDLVKRVADSDASVLITGESGTGKELVARAIHSRSPRQEHAFVAINCAAMPPNLLESELFGHVRGAFTDAKRSRDGLFVQANRGTLFFDEIGEMPLEMQPKLLRALQENKARPVGGNTELSFDTRIIAATNCNLEEAIAAGAFREDLFYRINVVHIHLPPLRGRGNDVLLLAQHFLDRLQRGDEQRVKGISPPAAQRLLDYEWPGNVRELENCIERAVTLARYNEITVDDLPERIRDYRSSHVVIAGDDPEQLLSLSELEQRYIHRVLKAVDGNKTQAAKVLGLDRRTLYRKLERYANSGGPRSARSAGGSNGRAGVASGSSSSSSSSPY